MKIQILLRPLQSPQFRSFFLLSSILASSSSSHCQNPQFKSAATPTKPNFCKSPAESQIKVNTKMSTAKKNLTIEEAEAELLRTTVVVIDEPEKIFKYILIKANVGTKEKLFIRGSARHEYHADIFDEFTDFAKRSIHPQVKLQCLGGGRIDRQENDILLYGYSQGFGRADHAKAADLVRAQFPEASVNWTNDGY